VASKHSDELRTAAVRQITVEGRPLKEVAQAMEVAPATLRRWLKAAAETGSSAEGGGSAPAAKPHPHLLRLILLDGVDIGPKLERILHNEGFELEVCHLRRHQLGEAMPAATWLECATLFSLAEAGARRLVDLIERSGKDIPIAWLGHETAWSVSVGVAMDCEWVPEATPERLQYSLGRLHERRRMRTQLRDCQCHFEHLQRCCLRAFDGSTSPIAIVRPEGHIYANPAYMRRFGYEEFSRLQDLPPGELLAADDAPRLTEALALLREHEQPVFEVTLSSGVRMRAELERFPGSSNGAQLTLRPCGPARVEADSPPVPARAAGPDDVPASDGALAEWTERIAQALKADDRFSVLYQPIVSLSGDAEASYEALLRLHDEQGGEYLPGVFLPAARQAGLMGVVDQWVIRRAAIQVKAELAAGRQVRIFVNLARESLLGDDFRHWLETLIGYYRIPPSALVFEIPECLPMRNLQACCAVVGELRALGCGIVMDDFDGGEEAFSLLDELAIDGIKFDQSRIRLITGVDALEPWIRTIVARVHALGGRVIASRVQDAASVALLWQCGVDYVQGFFLQQPSRVLDYDFISSECEVTEKRTLNPFSAG
jgi:EAL domain-containing protein (putative c-di-GMP-specific phosphodiesterase class I)/PAS domain-containing protein